MVLQIYSLILNIIFGLNNSGINFLQYSLILHITVLIFFNQFNRGIPTCGKIDHKTLNKNVFYYPCSKDGPDFLFGNLMIRDKIDEPFFPFKNHVNNK